MSKSGFIALAAQIAPGIFRVRRGTWTAAGKTFGKIGSAATGMAFSFAITYALGQVAKRYYAGGRTMDTAVLRDTFQSLLGPAKQMQTRYLPQIEQKAATLDAGQIMAMIRGNQGGMA